ncbi:MAG: septum formation initiator family protein [Lachnospiraceae bacterium]|nr:septum formation initiator family protein [Lachnospiraceae bacterium]
MGRSRKKRRRAGKSRTLPVTRLRKVIAFLLACLLIVVLLLLGLKLQEKVDSARLRQQELEAAIVNEQERTESILSLREYMDSDEYIRQAAKDRLGLVESGEVVLKPSE